jgi:chaperonin cofactor prefoldin
MADPDNLVLKLLREIRSDMNARFDTVDRRFDEIDQRLESHDKRFESLRQAINGESVLGRYAVSEVDERLDAIEKRLDAIEKRQ